MDKWIYYGMRQVEELTRTDPYYLELLEEHRKLLPDFEALLEKLTFEDRELLLEYLNLQIDLQAQETRIAYHLHNN
ncbi:MAG: hypothetical protein IJ960_03695 [Oscillospiraceae bacterium]|nr:hypothetical protein [Oscillospiraceae bacterium]